MNSLTAQHRPAQYPAPVNSEPVNVAGFAATNNMT
jgi:hypothetical protein